LTVSTLLLPVLCVLQAFLEGFWQLVPRELIAIFNDHELELLISGLPDIDVSDLRANTMYSNYSPASPVIQWFWQVVADMDKQDLALLLQFVTGEPSPRGCDTVTFKLELDQLVGVFTTRQRSGSACKLHLCPTSVAV
jgi:hypothetical protein